MKDVVVLVFLPEFVSNLVRLLVKHFFTPILDVTTTGLGLEEWDKSKNEDESISLIKGSSSNTFDRIIKRLDRIISGIKTVPSDTLTAYVAQNKLESSKILDEQVPWDNWTFWSQFSEDDCLR